MLLNKIFILNLGLSGGEVSSSNLLIEQASGRLLSHCLNKSRVNYTQTESEQSKQAHTLHDYRRVRENFKTHALEERESQS